MSIVGDDNPLIQGSLINPATWCPDKSTWNPQTNQCETPSKAPPPALPIKKSWAWWQWVILAGSIGFAGIVGYELNRRRRPAMPDFFPFSGE